MYNSPEKPIRVVIVDDYHLMRLGIRLQLEDGRNVEIVGEAEDGETSLALIQKTRPDIVLMDLGLPGIDGIETTRQLKQIAPDVKVIILTSHDASQQVEAAHQAGANAYCLKETPSRHMLEIIQKVANNQGWFDPYTMYQENTDATVAASSVA